MIRIENLTVKFGDVVATSVEKLEIAEAERVAVVGRNGGGKSTLLRVLAGLQPPTTGRLDGLLPPGDVTLVHQSPYLFRGTALENVEYARRLRGGTGPTSREWLEKLGAAEFAGRAARTLSGGERRRVALARAFAVRPRLLLLDEPFAALDASGVRQVREAIDGFDGTVVIASPEPDILESIPGCRRVDLNRES